VQLLLLVLAAMFAIVPIAFRGFHWGALLAGVAFGAAFLIETTILTIQPEKVWYQGRAVAESIKSLAWRFAVGGSPFGRSLAPAHDVDQPFSQRLRQVLAEFESVSLIPTDDTAGEITAWMRHRRASSLTARKETYRRGRIEEQRQWYASKARWNQRRSNAWSISLLIVQTLGVTSAILRGTGVIDLDLLGVMAAIAASGVAWLQIKQHATLTQSYSQAANELSSIGTLVETIENEGDWARFVDDAEGAISREHTAWRAKRSQP
jgi:hypothetical protein